MKVAVFVFKFKEYFGCYRKMIYKDDRRRKIEPFKTLDSKGQNDDFVKIN